VDCDFENFSIKGAIMQNLLSHSGLPDFRQVILGENLDMDDTLVWAKEMEQKYGDGIVLIKVEPDEEETDFVSNSLNLDNTKMVHVQRWNFFNTVSHSQESTSNYVNRLVNVAGDCDFENFSIKGAIMQNLLAHSGLPDFRQVILDENLDMDDTLVWAKEMEQKYGDGIVSVKVEPDEEETDIVSNSLNPDNAKMVHVQRWNFFNTVPHPQESTSDYVNRLVKVAVDCDFENFSVKGAIMQNLLTHSGLPNLRQVIIDEKLDMDDTLVWAKEIEQRCSAEIVSVKVELDEDSDNIQSEMEQTYDYEMDSFKIEESQSIDEDLDKIQSEETNYVSDSLDPDPDNINSVKQEKCDDIKNIETSTFQNLKKSNSLSKKNLKNEGVRYSCDQCGFTTTDRTYLKKHKATVHEGVRYPCDQCDRAPFTQVGALNKHKESVHKGIRYPCDQCNFTTTDSTYLKKHKASVHKGIKFQCDECDASFTQSCGLTKHKAVHEGIRYPCDQCDALPFTQSGHLKRHKASVHEGVRFLCEDCDSLPFSSKNSLSRHREAKHGTGKYPCDQCDYIAKQNRGLKRHKETKHK